MKKLLTILGLLLLLITFVGCKPNPDSDPDPDPDPNPNGEVDILLAAKWNEALKDKKIYLTTCGQADIDIVENLLRVAGLTTDSYTRNHLLEAKDVEEGSVVLLVVGSSGKGLGAAGTDVNQENARAQAFATKANKGSITVILFHIGGVARRGDLSDTVITSAANGSSLMLVVKTGNADNLFTNLVTAERELYLYSATAKILPAIKFLFGLE